MRVGDMNPQTLQVLIKHSTSPLFYKLANSLETGLDVELGSLTNRGIANSIGALAGGMSGYSSAKRRKQNAKYRLGEKPIE